MTQKLYEMLKKKYPREWNSFPIYGADERINISLKDKSFIGKDNLISINELEKIANNYFKDFYKIEDAKKFGLRGVFVLFEVDGIKKYQNYFGHSFWIPRFVPLDMEISTGNRGNFLLTKKQRENYFRFVNDIFEKVKKNALKD